jgi:hypothetical protein
LSAKLNDIKGEPLKALIEVQCKTFKTDVWKKVIFYNSDLSMYTTILCL